jgi:hypothetical protein
MVGRKDESLANRAALAFGGVDVLSAGLVALAVFGGLPDRYWLVDGCALAVILLLGAAGVGLMMRATWARRAAQVASFASLAIGLTLVATLALTASYLSGIYGPVGRGGAIILVLVAALALPYLVVLPAAQLVWVARAPAAAPRT